MKNKNKQTKFPVARIKKIMQKDEEVGKVAQATPIVISKALELFLGLLIEESSKVTIDRGSKKVESYHLKHAVETTEMLDFLKEIVEAVPDPSAGGTIDLEAENAEGKKKRKKKPPTAGGGAMDVEGGGAGAGAGLSTGGPPAPKRQRRRRKKPAAAAAAAASTSAAEDGAESGAERGEGRKRDMEGSDAAMYDRDEEEDQQQQMYPAGSMRRRSPEDDDEWDE